MKILVTGGTGYIGSHTAVELEQAGFEVVLLDNLSNSYDWVADRIGELAGRQVELARVDLSAWDETEAFFRKHHDFVGVIHFAALKAVGESVEQPLRYYRNNLYGLINLLHAMEVYGIRNLVFSSSCTVYGSPIKLPVHENTPLQPAISPYGNTKIISESIIRDTVLAAPLKCIALRYFNPIGAHPSALIGELPIGVPSNLLPYITQTAIGKHDHLKVFGGDYPTPDGTAIRDYIHVTDLAKAHVTAINRMIRHRQKAPWEVFNLGTGMGYSVLEVIHTFEEAAGITLPYKITDRRPGDVPAIWADPSLANKELGWKAEKDLAEMVGSAWEWEMKL